MKKLLAIAVVITMLFTLAIPIMASGDTREWKDGFGFHCNNAKGNGKVVTGFEKATVTLERVGNTTTWNLETDEIVCPVCDRIDWVTFSNKNGAINGKNIQVNHSAEARYPGGVDNDCTVICNDCFGFLCDHDDCDPKCSCEDEIPVINLGFIGYYLSDGKVLSTSIHWQYLEPGVLIDWDAVDAAYADWVARGGLAPLRATWQTSGFSSFTFEDYATLGFGDFTAGQLESYYKAWYVCPYYVLPGSGGNLEDDCTDICGDCFGFLCEDEDCNPKCSCEPPYVCECKCALTCECKCDDVCGCDCQCTCPPPYVCECDLTCKLNCKGGNGTYGGCNAKCGEPCTCTCKCTFWPGKGCQHCQGNNIGKRCDGSNPRNCPENQQ